MRGGLNAGLQLGAQQNTGGGVYIGSPTIQVAPQVMTQTDSYFRYDSYTLAPVNVAAGILDTATQR